MARLDENKKEVEETHVRITIKKDKVDMKEAVDALAVVADAAEALEGWEVDSLGVETY